MNKIDWLYLRQSLIIVVLSVMAAFSMGVFGFQYESRQIEKYDKAVETLRTTHTLYINMVNDIDLLEQYRNLYSEKIFSLTPDQYERLIQQEKIQRVHHNRPKI